MPSKKPLIVITGASSGIGMASAQLFASEGYPLLLLARRLKKMKALGLPNCLCKKVDVSDEAAIKAAITEAEESFGPTDCLINNAGRMLLQKLSLQDPLEWTSMIDVNLRGLLNGISAVSRAMIDRQGGTIINIGSLAGKNVFKNHAVYAATKAGVHMLSETLRRELSSYNVRVSTIIPGAVETELLEHISSETIKRGYHQWMEGIGGALDPKAVAKAIFFAYSLPAEVCIRELVVAATRQES